ncbi:MAG: hypothetical protein ISS77_02710 [Phycisphaerae bacterium]|nr:hypothetical protein [Phycisphaerae bacterium]
MSSMDKKDFEVLVEYSMGLCSEKERIEAEKIISKNPQAAELVKNFEKSLAPLDHLHFSDCPDHLFEKTISKLNGAASFSQQRLADLIAAEQSRTKFSQNRFWVNFGEVIAVAAMIFFISAVVISPLRYARTRYWQGACRNQLGSIARGIENYKADNNGQMPAVATMSGDPWWKVGYQGRENHSNTRHMWLLVKKGYVDVDDFVCPGRREGRALQLDPSKVSDFNDFPARRYVTYSFRIRCKENAPNPAPAKMVWVADLNPLFEKLPEIFEGNFKLRLNDKLRSINSSNHGRKGQNLLFCDGSVRFNKTRLANISNDDIFTLKDTVVYEGNEMPSCQKDAFLAP